MYITHSKEIVPKQDRIAQVQAIAWSPDSSRLAVCNAENAILLFDEDGERRDKFMTKSIDAETNRTGYAIKGLCFSADSTKLAVGQTDCAVFVYKLGKQWSDKKVICNKFVHKGPVMCLIWIAEHGIIAGTLEGRVRLANPRTNKTSTVYNTEVMVTALASCHDGDKFVSGHSDGSIVIYSFGTSAAKKFCSHPVAPNLLLWSLNTLVAAGCDKRVLIYDSSGALFQQLVHGNEPEVREVCSAAASPGGQTIALGSYDKFQTYTWSNKKSGWVEAETIRIKNMYIVKPLCWKSDGSKIAIGGSSGAVELFDCCLKQMILNKNFEVSYTGHNQILIRSRVGPERLALRSHYGEEISDVAVLGKDRFVVAKSKNSLLLGDFLTGKSSEIAWQSAGNEKYYFEFENVSFGIGNRKAM